MSLVAARLARLLALVCATVLLLAPAGAGAAPGVMFGACGPTQVIVPAAGLQCGRLLVAFDRADPSLGSIALVVQRVPASAPKVGTIVLLAGGPGQPALPAFEGLLAPLAHQLRGFELVAFDQRGTGQSEGLQCPEPTTSLRGGPVAYFGACGAALGATRAFYTSQESVEDLESLRQALGGAPLSLYAVSYGGRVAGMYAREHPQGLARMVLDSPTPLTGTEPLQLVRLHALHQVLDEGICGAGACRAFTPDVYSYLTRLTAILRRHPLHTRIYSDRGRLRSVSVTEGDVLRLLSVLDLAKGTREITPAAISAAAHGDAVPLARLTSGLGEETPAGTIAPATPPVSGIVEGEAFKAQAPLGDSAISVPLFVATFCDESSLPWPADSRPQGRPAALRRWLASQPAQAFAPFASLTAVAGSVVKLCLEWPATPPAPPPPTGTSAVPTLLLSGEDDLRTPYEQTRALAAGYTRGELLRIPDTGHSTVSTDLTGCARNAMLQFLTTGQPPATCPGSSEPQALPLPAASLSSMGAAAGSGMPARVASAAAMTLEDLFGQTTMSGGLHGGYWEQRPSGVALHNLTDVPGVTLNGTIHANTPTNTGIPALSGKLTIHGRLAGTLTLHGPALTGRIAGAHVHTRLAGL